MANYIVNAYNNGGSDGSVNMRSGPAKPTELGAHVPYGATSCEVGPPLWAGASSQSHFNPPTSCEVGQQKSLTVIVS